MMNFKININKIKKKLMNLLKDMEKSMKKQLRKNILIYIQRFK